MPRRIRSKKPKAGSLEAILDPSLRHLVDDATEILTTPTRLIPKTKGSTPTTGYCPDPPDVLPEQFIIWCGHTGKPQLNGPNGKRVKRVVYDDDSEQSL